MVLLIKRLLSIIHEDKRRKLPLVFAMFIAMAVLDLVGIGILPILAPRMAGLKDGLVEGVDNKTLIITVAAGVMLLFMVKIVVSYALQRYVLYFGEMVRRDVICDLTTGYFNAPYEENIRRSSFESIGLASHGSNSVSVVLTSSLRAFCDMLSFSLIILMLIVVDPYSTIGLLAVFAVFISVYKRSVRTKLSAYGKQVQENGIRMGRHLQQGIYAQKEVRLLGTVPNFVDETAHITNSTANANVYIGAAQVMPRLAIEFILINFAVLFFVVRFVLMDDVEGSIAFVAALSAAGLRLFPGLTSLINSSNTLRQLGWSVHEVYEEITYFRSLPPLHRRTAEEQARFAGFGEIKVSDVSYSYPGADKPVLQNISFSIRQGEVVGLIGRSGAGKSTLADVLMGFLTPTQGSVTVDGADIRQLNAAWMSQIGYVPQALNILDDSIVKNVALGIPAEEVDLPRVAIALREAQLHVLADAVEQHRDYALGDRGSMLSGGQRQRLAIARALYFKRKVVVVDEATSALDNETEKAVMESIQDLRGKVTIILIAHRYSTLAACDAIYELEDGKLVAKLNYADVKARIA